MIPKGYTPSRVVYNAINKKDHGSCMVCHKETKWDEDKQRYNSLCDRPKCKQEYVKIVRSRMIKKYGTHNLLTNPEFQKKMLENRSISGKYKFQDGGSVGYVGSYEKKFLEFMDTFLHIKSYDIISPGPNIPYMYKGKEHIWITDFLYEPYNLVFDIKDGGDNPNTRDMKDYREKQIAKEKAIAEYGDYNYIRLTDNKFEQLIHIFMELKEKVDDKPLISINESCDSLINARKLCNEVRKIAKKYNANFFFVTDGASAYSNGNGENNPAVKSMRVAMDELEKENGFNPDDDWSNDINDTSKYKLKGAYIKESKFDPPYSEKQIKDIYGTKVYNKLIKDPAHKYRMQTGIELIHKEPSKDELERIWKNWNLMDPTQKIESDKKSIELFGKTNKDHYMELITVYNESYVEESTKSSLDINYKSKGKKNLSSFKRIHLTESIIDKYKKEYPFLKHVRCKDTK